MLSAAFSTVCGVKHARNEDACVVLPEYGLFAVADGMGGHHDGAYASAAVVRGLSRAAEAVAADGSAVLQHCLEEVNGELRRRAEHHRRISGSTVAALLVRGTHFAGFWAGDSRIYHLQRGRLKQVSRDHSEIQELVDQGVLAESDAKHWPRRNVITRAVGVHGTLALSSAEGDLEDRDGFVLCSDGLTTKVEPHEIETLLSGDDPQSACDALVDLAVTRGETDDVTVVIVRFAAEKRVEPFTGWEP